MRSSFLGFLWLGRRGTRRMRGHYTDRTISQAKGGGHEPRAGQHCGIYRRPRYDEAVGAAAITVHARTVREGAKMTASCAGCHPFALGSAECLQADADSSVLTSSRTGPGVAAAVSESHQMEANSANGKIVIRQSA